ncbi:hypothetical protein L3Q82_022604 [Scortum barcoo]|uniref:Uncharacterized protein n=1 Tax=Scortum barcoo TaxID=214431 RepID=A0ACB8X2W3_9TELE|nr:hypothetical protein L3Q82_022604 [Scortum barcoo]
MSVLPLRVKIFRQVWRLKGVVILVCSPFILLPLAVSTMEAACAYVIAIALMAVYWCTEVLPLAVMALLADHPVPCPRHHGVQRCKTGHTPTLTHTHTLTVCMQYLKDTNMLFVGGLMVAVAVEHWNLHKRIALRVLLLVGVRPALLMLGFMGVTAFLSMWISNTATTAMMVPIVQAVLDQLTGNVDPEPSSRSQRRVVLHQEHEEKTSSVPSQTATPNMLENGLNGATLTQTNIVSLEQEVSSEGQMDKQEMIKPTPQDKPPSDSGPVVVSVENSCCQMELEELSDMEEERRRMSKGLLLCVCYAASIGGIATLTGTGPNLVLIGQMSQLFPQNGDVINFASWFAFAFPTMVLTLTLAWFWLQFLYIGCNFHIKTTFPVNVEEISCNLICIFTGSLRRTWGCGEVQSVKEQAVYEVIRNEHHRLGPMSYGEGSVLALFILMVALWFTRDPRFMDGWATHIFNAKAEAAAIPLLLEELTQLMHRVPGVTRPRPSSAHLAGDSEEDAVEHRAAAGRRLRSGQRQVPGSPVCPVGSALRWRRSTPSLPGPSHGAVLCLLIASHTFTECQQQRCCNKQLFLPILASMSQSISLNPLYVMIPCTLSASFAFMLPVATPPNAIVFSYGLLKVSDMAKAGVVMNIIGIGCISLAINSWGYILFGLDSFPSWANATAPV